MLSRYRSIQRFNVVQIRSKIAQHGRAGFLCLNSQNGFVRTKEIIKCFVNYMNGIVILTFPQKKILNNGDKDHMGMKKKLFGLLASWKCYINDFKPFHK